MHDPVFCDRETQRSWLMLFYLPGVGPARFHQLIEWFGSPASALSGEWKLLQSAGLKPEAISLLAELRDKGSQSSLWLRAEKELDWLANNDASLVLFDDPDYPPLLKQIHQPPPLLFVKGQRHHLSEPQLAVIGSRNASVDGMENARRFSRALVQSGITITSGLALGIDGAAHAGALEGQGITLAVMGTGLDQIYPAKHRRLAEQIAANGLLVTEYPLGTQPQANHFPRRNRIISGLSLGVLVVEASLQSGSLITARCALEQGREVFAIPGSIHNPMARGCHQLLRDGAKLVERADDIFDELTGLLAFHHLIRQQSSSDSIELSTADSFNVPNLLDKADLRADSSSGKHTGITRTPDLFSPPGVQLDEQAKQILSQMGYQVVSIDTLVERTGLAAAILMQELLMLELNGLVETAPGGYRVLQQA
ncbi:MAG: DNA-protecting protein DprA [Hahellaceae bacterium]|nr:DNA-protecting protein DprA [Hahellaceae bacterium]